MYYVKTTSKLFVPTSSIWLPLPPPPPFFFCFCFCVCYSVGVKQSPPSSRFVDRFPLLFLGFPIYRFVAPPPHPLPVSSPQT